MCLIRCVLRLSVSEHALTLRLGSRVDLAAPSLAQWLVLRRDTQYGALLLHLPVLALALPEVLDSCGDALPDIQPHFLVVRPRKFP